MPSIVDQAICIRAWDWSETSQTSLLFSREHGMVRALAKGSRRPRSAFSGGLEPLTRGEMVAILKPSAELANLTEWDVQEFFPAIRRDLGSFHAAMYLADLVQHGVTDRDPHPVLYDALCDALRGLGQGASVRALVLRFQWSVLVEVGYRPELARDVERAAPLDPARTYAFVPSLGGLTRDDASGGRDIERWRVREDTVEVLRAVATHEAPALSSVSSDCVERAMRFLNAYLSQVLGRASAAFDPLVTDGHRARS